MANLKEKLKNVWKEIWKDYPPITAYGDSGLPSIGCLGITALATAGFAILSWSTCQSDFENTLERKKPLLQKSNSPITAIVLEDFYEKGENNSNYTLKCMTDKNKEIYVSVMDAPDKKKESLDSLISKGTKIAFPKGNISEKKLGYFGYLPIKEETYFTDSTKFASKRADRIKILKD